MFDFLKIIEIVMIFQHKSYLLGWLIFIYYNIFWIRCYDLLKKIQFYKLEELKEWVIIAYTMVAV